MNLGAFETFFAERRPFFVEGSGNFSFDLDCSDGECTGLFYSRRIGRAPHRFVDAPERRLRGAAGQLDDPRRGQAHRAASASFSIGALNARHDRRETRIWRPARRSIESTSPVEPFTSYSVVRASREFANQLAPGLHASRARTGALTDELRFLPDTAVTGGIDGDWRLGSGRYSLTGVLGRQHGARSRGRDRSPAAQQRPQLPAAGRRPRDLRPAPHALNGHAGRGQLQQDQRPAHARQLVRRLQVARLRGQRPRFPVARRRHLDQQLVSDPRRQARASTSGTGNINFNQWGGLELRRRPPLLRRQHQHATGRSSTTGASARLQRQRRRLRRSAHARRTGRARTGQPEPVGLLRHPTTARRSRELLRLLVVQRPAGLVSGLEHRSRHQLPAMLRAAHQRRPAT